MRTMILLFAYFWRMAKTKCFRSDAYPIEFPAFLGSWPANPFLSGLQNGSLFAPSVRPGLQHFSTTAAATLAFPGIHEVKFSSLADSSASASKRFSGTSATGGRSVIIATGSEQRRPLRGFLGSNLEPLRVTHPWRENMKLRFESKLFPSLITGLPQTYRSKWPCRFSNVPRTKTSPLATYAAKSRHSKPQTIQARRFAPARVRGLFWQDWSGSWATQSTSQSISSSSKKGAAASWAAPDTYVVLSLPLSRTVPQGLPSFSAFASRTVPHVSANRARA